MSADKYPSIFSRQMKAIVYIYLLYLIWSRNTSAIKRTENIFAARRKMADKSRFGPELSKAEIDA